MRSVLLKRRFRGPWSLRISASCSAMVAIAELAIVALCGTQLSAQNGPRVVLSPAGDRISISAVNVPRGELLDLLRKEYKIEVRPYAAVEERISVSATNVPIDSAIRLVMPRGSRYIVRNGERDIVLAVRDTGRKRGPAEQRAPGLTTNRTSRITHSGPGFKPPPERVVAPRPTEGAARKPLAASTRNVPPGRGPKLPRAVNGQVPADSTLRISFIIRAPDSVRVVRAQVIPGAVIAPTIVHGPFLFAFRDATDRLVFYGTLLDPLEEHSYDTTGRHGQARAAEGTFAISVPTRIVPTQRLAALRLEFFDGRNVALPQPLDAAAFQRAAAQAKSVARLEGRALLAALR